ncbi:MAG TPA: hypothetical protein VNU02_06215 [Candidatus Dormibacteraeota bacterium]|nr:hypothetical protein [Candidatus Dormibacteraeota bacterium]
MRGVAGFLLALVLAGCGPIAFGPAYTDEELAQSCVRRGGWWRPDDLRGGFCEFEAPGFL